MDATKARLGGDLERARFRLDRLAHALAHDLSESLGMVSLYARLLGDRLDAGEDREAARYASGLTRGLDRLDTLVDGLHRYARVTGDGLDAQPVDCAALVADVLTGLRPRLEDAAAQVEVGALPEVDGDREQLAQVFSELVANALRYRSESPLRLALAAEPAGGEWHFSLSDNGVGVAEELCERVLLPFERGDAPHDASRAGIGLAVCQAIIERHGGRIWIEPGPEAGSVCHFTLPRSPR